MNMKFSLIATARPSVRSIITALAVLFCLSACQMPSPASSSGQSGSPSGGAAPSSGSPSTSPPSPSSSGGNEPTEGGAEASGDSVGESGNPQGKDDGGIDGSDGESIEGLDAALDASLEGFDDSVGGSSSQGPSEIDILSPSGSSGVTAGTDKPLFEEADSGTPGESNAEVEQAAQDGPQPQADSEGAAGPLDQQGGGQQQTSAAVIPIPDDIDDGQGDGIVLRQLRDAAMKETDPALRERLWDEYRRIKNQ
jgi:hypothetical protein